MRAFIAIDLPESVKDAISDLQADLPTGQPSPSENLHLTLAFLGEQPTEMIEDIHTALCDLTAPGFDLQLAGTDTFGGNDPKVVFAAVKPNPALEHLHRKIRSLAHGAGFVLDRQRFRPHVTIARFRRRPTAPEMERLRGWLLAHSNFGTEPFPVTEISLYRSTLSRAGAFHDELARYPLG